jgi:hypothetical protein
MTMANCHELKHANNRMVIGLVAINKKFHILLYLKRIFLLKRSCNVYKSNAALLYEFRDLQEGGCQLVHSDHTSSLGNTAQNFD